MVATADNMESKNCDINKILSKQSSETGELNLSVQLVVLTGLGQGLQTEILKLSDYKICEFQLSLWALILATTLQILTVLCYLLHGSESFLRS